jgi:hypothetical protein
VKPEAMWCIANKKFGLYCLSNFTSKRGAIKIHCQSQGQSWKECVKQGDYCIKIWIRVFDE